MVKHLSALQETRVHPWVGKIPWRRKWQPTPVFLPEKSHGPWSLVGYHPWGRKESDTTEWLHFHLFCDLLWAMILPHESQQRLWNIHTYFPLFTDVSPNITRSTCPACLLDPEREGTELGCTCQTQPQSVISQPIQVVWTSQALSVEPPCWAQPACRHPSNSACFCRVLWFCGCLSHSLCWHKMCLLGSDLIITLNALVL